jgi:RHS repeat-associated protein
LVWYEGAGTTSRRWLHADERGSVIAVTDSSGATLAINSYDAWGIPAASNLGRFQYTGQAWIPEIGLYYYKARVYSPTLGRFLSADPIGYGDGMNMYAYVGNDPVNRADPLGLFFSQICEKRGGNDGGTWGNGGTGIVEATETVCHYHRYDDLRPTPGGDSRTPGGPSSSDAGDQSDQPQSKQCPAPSGGQSAIPSGAGAISFSDAEVIARRIANEELARTQRITDNYRLGGHNDIYDAERHARWVYRMSIAIGSGWAGRCATAQEGEGMVGGQPFIEMRMDLNNNSLGMNAAINGTGMPTRSTPGLMHIREGKLIRQTC